MRILLLNAQRLMPVDHMKLRLAAGADNITHLTTLDGVH